MSFSLIKINIKIFQSEFHSSQEHHRACNLILKTTTQVFSCEYCEVFNKTYFEHLTTVASVQSNIVSDKSKTKSNAFKQMSCINS